MLYAKYSRSYVSGGQIATLTWKPEFAKSWEAGVKTTLLDGKLRANLAVFSVTYENLQFAKAGSAFALVPALCLLPTLVVGSRSPARARGFELELTAAPTRGLTLGANLGYTDFKYLGTLNWEVLITAACALRNSRCEFGLVGAGCGVAAAQLLLPLAKWRRRRTTGRPCCPRSPATFGPSGNPNPCSTAMPV